MKEALRGRLEAWRNMQRVLRAVSALDLSARPITDCRDADELAQALATQLVGPLWACCQGCTPLLIAHAPLRALSDAAIAGEIEIAFDAVVLDHYDPAECEAAFAGISLADRAVHPAIAVLDARGALRFGVVRDDLSDVHLRNQFERTLFPTCDALSAATLASQPLRGRLSRAIDAARCERPASLAAPPTDVMPASLRS